MNKSRFARLSLLSSLTVFALGNLAFGNEGNGKGNGYFPSQQQGNYQQQNQTQQQQQAQNQQQQQQLQQQSQELDCIKSATVLGWAQSTAEYVCEQTQMGDMPIQCVVYSQNASDWPKNGSQWPYTALLCRQATSPSEPIECAKKQRALGQTWPQTVETCRSKKTPEPTVEFYESTEWQPHFQNSSAAVFVASGEIFTTPLRYCYNSRMVSQIKQEYDCASIHLECDLKKQLTQKRDDKSSQQQQHFDYGGIQMELGQAVILNGKYQYVCGP